VCAWLLTQGVVEMERRPAPHGGDEPYYRYLPTQGG
jgi:hypothetical protein